MLLHVAGTVFGKHGHSLFLCPAFLALVPEASIAGWQPREPSVLAGFPALVSAPSRLPTCPHVDTDYLLGSSGHGHSLAVGH